MCKCIRDFYHPKHKSDNCTQLAGPVENFNSTCPIHLLLGTSAMRCMGPKAVNQYTRVQAEAYYNGPSRSKSLFEVICVGSLSIAPWTVKNRYHNDLNQRVENCFKLLFSFSFGVHQEEKGI